MYTTDLDSATAVLVGDYCQESWLIAAAFGGTLCHLLSIHSRKAQIHVEIQANPSLASQVTQLEASFLACRSAHCK